MLVVGWARQGDDTGGGGGGRRLGNTLTRASCHGATDYDDSK